MRVRGADRGGALFADLTLPGTIPGLLRRGSPVLDRGVPGVYLRSVQGDDFAKIGLLHGEVGMLPLSLVELDLTDATGRAHAAWWLDQKCDRHGTWAGAALWHVRRGDLSDDEVTWGPYWTSRPPDLKCLAAYCCRSLADLDPGDCRELADGSYWTDAEALRRVVLHLAKDGGGG